jgi:hypothetical protein
VVAALPEKRKAMRALGTLETWKSNIWKARTAEMAAVVRLIGLLHHSGLHG